jgi:hypothetical protein
VIWQRNMVSITIHIETAAPSKPALGAPCNGCGVCCLAEPCPLGVALSGRRHGSCVALRWDAAGLSYRCGALVDAAKVLRSGLPHLPGFTLPVLARWLPKLARRWVAVGTGCDCDMDVPDQSQTPQVESPASGASP